MSEVKMVDGHVQCPRCKHAIYAYSEVYICGSCGASGDSLDGVDVPPVVEELEASLALISDAMIRGSKRWRDAHPNSNIVIPDLANLVEWLLEQIQIRDGKITTLEAEVRRAEDVAKIEQDYKLMLDYSHDESADLGKKLDAAEAECDDLRAQLATISRCARALVEEISDDRGVTFAAAEARDALLSALDSGGEGESGR